MNAPTLFCGIILAAGIFTARADDEKFPLLKAGADTYTNVTVTSHNATDIYFIHAGGMANVKIAALSPELQKHFGFDAQKARAAETKLAADKAQYHAQTMQAAAAATAAAEFWRDSLATALKQARAQQRLVLLDFTGSDWCPWCAEFDRDILSTPRFIAYARQKLMLIQADFPRHAAQADDLKRVNQSLADHFEVKNFPTFILLDAGGNELGRQVGYLRGGPDAFIAELEKFSR